MSEYLTQAKAGDSAKYKVDSKKRTPIGVLN